MVDHVWLQVTYGLEHACMKTGGSIDANYLWTECRSGQAFLIVVTCGEEVCGASVHRIEKWTSGKKLRCLGLYGRDMKAWHADHLQIVKQIARAGGATSLVTLGRRGFERVFPQATVLGSLIEVEV